MSKIQNGMPFTDRAISSKGVLRYIHTKLLLSPNGGCDTTFKGNTFGGFFGAIDRRCNCGRHLAFCVRSIL